MFKSAYDTLPCRVYKMDDIYKGLEMAIAGNNPAVHSLGPVMIAQDMSSIDRHSNISILIDGLPNMNLFAHPVVITMYDNTKNPSIYSISDARDVTKVDFSGQMKVTSPAEFNLIRARTYLQAKWVLALESGITSLPIHSFPLRIFARWIAESLTRRFNLDLDASLRVQAIAGFMYLSMHQEKKDLEPHDLVDISVKIGRSVSVPVNIVSEVLDGIGYFENVVDFCDELTQRVGSSHLDGLNPIVLYGIIRGAWFGKNASEMVAVSIEHPPTFDALIYAAASTSSLQRTNLGTLVKAELRDKEALSYVEKVNGLILNKE